MDVYARQVSSYLLTQSWQIALLAVAVGLLSFALRNRSAHIRYLLWLVVLAKCLVPPYLTIPLAVLPERSYAEPLAYVMSREAPAPLTVTTETGSSIPVSDTTNTSVARSAPFNLRRITVVLWLAGVLLFFLWIGSRAIRYTLWLRRHRTSLPHAISESLQDLLAGLRLRRSPRIWLTEDIAQPFVWGVFRGSVYLPAAFVDAIDLEQQRNILAHELSHIARFDAGINIFQVVAQAIYWFHPFVWWTNRKIRQEREKCCDEATIARLNAEPEEYSSAIVEALAAKRRSTRPVPSLAIASPVRDIEERIRAMMTPGKKFQKHPSLVAATLSALIAILIVPTALVLTVRAQTANTSETVDGPKEKPRKSLHAAAEAGDLAEVKRLLVEGADVNARDDRRRTALHLAAKHGYTDIAKMLIANGADVNAKSDKWQTALQHVAERGHRELAGLLIAQGARVDEKCEATLTALHYAVWRGQRELSELLIAEGADIHARTRSGLKVVDFAAISRDKKMVELLFLKGAAFPELYTALYMAMTHDDKEIVELLVSKGAEVSPVNLAAYLGDLKKVENLLSDGAGIDAKDKGGYAPLHCAVCAGHKEVVEFLLGKRADVDVRSRFQEFAALHLVNLNGQTGVAELLIAEGADVNAREHRRKTPLHCACLTGRKDLVELLVTSGADINARDNAGLTPLHEAAWTGRKNMAELLISKGADINAKTDENKTALTVAEEEGKTEIVDLLRKHGAKE